MRSGFVGFILCLAATMATAADVTPPPCPKGYVCISVAEMAERTAVVWELQAERAHLRMRARRFGCVVGGGVGVSAVVDESWETQAAPAAHLGVTCGWRFP